MDSYLAPVNGAKTILLTTYKRDGTPVATAVSIAFDGGRALFRTYDRAYAHRLRGYRTLHYELRPAAAPGR
jgi:hypothetical protein